jgi:hypothetical protein
MVSSIDQPDLVKKKKKNGEANYMRYQLPNNIRVQNIGKPQSKKYTLGQNLYLCQLSAFMVPTQEGYVGRVPNNIQENQ